MADVVTTTNDPNDPNNPNNQSGSQNPINVGGAGGASAGTGGSSSGTSGSGGSTSSTGTASSGNTGQGVGTTNVSQAAAQSGTPNYGFIGTDLQNENNSLNGLMNTAYNNFLTSAGTAPAFNQSTYNNAINNSGDSTDQSTVKGWLTGSYTGPSTWDTSSFTPQMTQYNQDVTGLNSSQGLYNWLTSQGGETPGQAQLDSAALIASPAYQASWNGWNTADQNATNQYNNYGTQAGNYVTNLDNAWTDLNSATNANLQGTVNSNMNNFNGIVNADNQNATNLYNQYNSDINQTGTAGVSYAPYYQYTAAPTATLNNALTQSQVTTYNNAESILGGSLLNPTGGWQNGNITYDSAGYNSAVSAAQAAQAAAAAAAAQPVQQAPVYVPSGGGGSFICTELTRQGLVKEEEKEEIHKRAEIFSDRLFRGYWTFALPVVRWMRKSKTVTKIALHIFKEIHKKTMLGNVYIAALFVTCNICSLFADEHKEFIAKFRGRTA